MVGTGLVCGGQPHTTALTVRDQFWRHIAFSDILVHGVLIRDWSWHHFLHVTLLVLSSYMPLVCGRLYIYREREREGEREREREVLLQDNTQHLSFVLYQVLLSNIPPPQKHINSFHIKDFVTK